MPHHQPFPQHKPDSADLSRRGFLKVGLGFSAALACAGLLPGLSGCSSATQAPGAGLHYLNAADVALFRALAPIVVADLSSLDALQRQVRIDAVLLNIDAACMALQSPQQQELRKLLGLLGVAPLRWMLTGVGSWHDATPAALQSFLLRWRASRFDTLNVGGNVLIKLIAASYYVLPVSWPAAGYPGPLDYVYQAVNS